MNTYLIATSIRMLIVIVMALVLVAAAAWAERRQRRRGDRSEAAASSVAAPGGDLEIAQTCECCVEEASVLRSSPTIVERAPQRRAA